MVTRTTTTTATMKKKISPSIKTKKGAKTNLLPTSRERLDGADSRSLLGSQEGREEQGALPPSADNGTDVGNGGICCPSIRIEN